MASKKGISPSQYRKIKVAAHEALLEALSNPAKLLPKLFLDLGIEKYVVREVFVEPRGFPGVKEISPDLVILYTNPDFNLLLVEAKSSNHSEALIRLEQQLYDLKGVVSESGDVDSTFYHTLGGRIPYETLQSCGIIAVGVFGTKSHSFKLYKTENIK